MTSTIHSPRRIVTAVLIAVLIGAAGVSAAGIEQVRPALSGTFGTVAPRPGDQADYTYQVVDARHDEPVAGEPVDLMRHERLGATTLLYDDGSPLPVAFAIRSTMGIDSHAEGETTWRVWAGLTEYINRDGHYAGLDFNMDALALFGRNASQRDDLGGLGLIQSTTQRQVQLQIHDFAQQEAPDVAGGALSPCGAIHALQGQAHDLSEPLRLFDACSIWDLPDVAGHPESVPEGAFGTGQPLWLHEEHIFQAIGHETIPEGNATVFSTDLDDGRAVYVWFVQDVAYPVQFVVQPDADIAVYEVLRLAESTSGDVESPPGMAPPSAVELAPVRPWGPEVGGIDHPYTAEQAWEHAMEDPDVIALMDAHDEAILTGMAGEPGNTVAGQSAYWSFMLADGRDRFGFTVDYQDDMPVQGYPHVATPVIWSPLQPRIDVRITEDAGTGPAIDATRIHDTAPTVASVVATLQRIDRVVDEPAYWGAELTCIDEVQDACRHWAYQTHAVHEEMSREPALDPDGPSAATDSTRHVAGLVMGHDGTLDHFARAIDASSTTFSTNEPPAWSPVPAPPTERLGWGDIETATVVGAGLLGALIAGLYYLRPAFMGLFSRIRDDEVIQHPSRRLLHDAIEADPGIHMQALVDALGKGRGTAEHHLRKLIDAGLVRRRDEGGYACYFPRHTDRRIMTAAPSLRSANARRILDYVRDHPGATGGEVAQALGVTRSTVSHHVQRMTDTGVLRTRRTGQAVRIWSTALIAA